VTAATAREYTPAQQALIERFLSRNYLPQGYRAQLMVGFPTIAAVQRSAVAAVVAAGADPARRVALVHPRPGEDVMREVDIVEYFRKYGHEYCVALLNAEAPVDIAVVTAAAHDVGCVILWDISGRDDLTVAQLSAWGVDAAVSTTSEIDVFELI
jgi:hypothetical protein